MPIGSRVSLRRAKFSNPFDEKWFAELNDVARREKLKKAVANEQAVGNFEFINVSRTRSNEFIKHEFGVDIIRLLRILVKRRKGKNIEMLDIGTGYMFLPPDVKQAFGDKVKVTALGLNPSDVSKKEDSLRKRLKELAKEKTPGIELKKRAVVRSLSVIETFKENLRSVDSYVFSLFENYAPEKKYDLLVDICGPSIYSEYQERVEEQYFNLSKVGSIVVTSLSGSMLISRFGSKSQVARETGVCFVPLKIKGLKGVSVFRKVALSRMQKR